MLTSKRFCIPFSRPESMRTCRVSNLTYFHTKSSSSRKEVFARVLYIYLVTSLLNGYVKTDTTLKKKITRDTFTKFTQRRVKFKQSWDGPVKSPE